MHKRLRLRIETLRRLDGPVLAVARGGKRIADDGTGSTFPVCRSHFGGCSGGICSGRTCTLQTDCNPDPT